MTDDKARPLELTAFSVRGEPIAYADAMRGKFEPFRVGEAWGPPWSTTWFHVRGQVPESWVGQPVIALFDLGFDGPTGFTCEALAWKDGKPWRGVDPNHRWLPIDGSDVDFYLEAAANPRATEAGAWAASPTSRCRSWWPRATWARPPTTRGDCASSASAFSSDPLERYARASVVPRASSVAATPSSLRPR